MYLVGFRRLPRVGEPFLRCGFGMLDYINLVGCYIVLTEHLFSSLALLVVGFGVWWWGGVCGCGGCAGL